MTVHLALFTAANLALRMQISERNWIVIILRSIFSLFHERRGQNLLLVFKTLNESRHVALFKFFIHINLSHLCM
jgi:hypothetical protein